MGIIARHSGAPFVDGETLAGADLESDFNTIYSEFNGAISSANLADGSVTSGKLGASAVTLGKMSDGAASMSEAQTTDDTGVTLTTVYQTLGAAVSHAVGNPTRHVVVMASFAHSGMTAFTILSIQLLKDGVSIFGGGIADNLQPHSSGDKKVFTRVYVDTAPTPGVTHTYTLQAKDTAGATVVKNMALVVFELRR